MFFKRFRMRIMGICLAVVVLVLLVVCAKNRVILPPARNVPYPGLVDYADVNFESVYSQAEAIVRIRVGNWLGEDTGIRNNTYFEATVLECYQGTAPEKFTLIQTGSSYGIDGRPLYTYGNELVIFLKKNLDEEIPFEDAYYNKGSFFSVFDVYYDYDGNRYYVIRNGWFGKSLPFTTPLSEIPMNEITEYAVKNDPILKETGFGFSYAFTERDFRELLEIEN